MSMTTVVVGVVTALMTLMALMAVVVMVVVTMTVTVVVVMAVVATRSMHMGLVCAPHGDGHGAGAPGDLGLRWGR